MSGTTRVASPLDARHLGPEAVRRELVRAHLRARRGLSQNFLADGEVLERIVAEAAVAPGRRVLEIGPGLGILTAALLERGVAVTAVELDDRLVGYLRRRLAGALVLPPGEPGSLLLVHGDILDVPLGGLVQPPFEVVANLPYHITSPVLHLLLGAGPRPERLVLMVQREVAERICAAPGGMSYLSVFVQYRAVARLAFTVPPAAFEPSPEVASAVVVLEVRPRPPADPEAEERLWRVVQAGFRERRKMLHNVLSRQLPSPAAARAGAALAAVGIEPARRPQTLSVDEWLALAAALGPLDR